FEADDTLTNSVQFIVEPAENPPVLRRLGSEIRIEQQKKYRGKVTPLVRLPAAQCPEINVNLGKGELSFIDIRATLTIKHGMGDVDVRGGSGPVQVSLGMGEVAISRRNDPLEVKNGMGDVAIDRCRGGINVALGRGDIAVAESGPDIVLKNGSGDIAVARPVDGQLHISTGKGDVAVSGGDAYGLIVNSGKGDIFSSARLSVRPGDQGEPVDEASDEDEEAPIFSFDEDITLNLSGLEFDAGEHGVRVTRDGRDVLKLGPEGVQISSGGRELSLGPEGVRLGGAGEKSSGDQRFSFETGRGDLHVQLPTDLKARVEVLATGDVQSDVPMVSVGRPGPRGTVKRLVGVTDGGDQAGRVNVRLRTGRGDVALRSMRVSPREPAQPAQRAEETDNEERARVILEALSRGDLSVGEAERLLAALERSG
ncbi:MAG TPA: DUF4097 family beta strand repeat-containing protein, partial [Thermomicrobiales bacterium]|nr:DUF4097 family beta strand repeat-containing protein [Thermomicrobiales bacterium]